MLGQRRHSHTPPSTDIESLSDGHNDGDEFHDNEPLLSSGSKRHMHGVPDGNRTAAILQRLKVCFYFGLWYALNVAYNSE